MISNTLVPQDNATFSAEQSTKSASTNQHSDSPHTKSQASDASLLIRVLSRLSYLTPFAQHADGIELLVDEAQERAKKPWYRRTEIEIKRQASIK